MTDLNKLTCPTGKVVYVSPGDATRSLHALQRKRKGHSPQVAYRCERCGRYHLASRSKRRR